MKLDSMVQLLQREESADSIEHSKRVSMPQISLRKFLRHHNPNLPAYREIISSANCFYINGDHSFFYLYGTPINGHIPDEKRLRQLHDFLKEKLEGHILVDLGGGFGHMDTVAWRLNARTYITVDTAYQNHLPDEDSTRGFSAHLRVDPENPMHYLQEITVAADMLDFVARVPSGTCNFVVNGITSDIIDSPEYHVAVAQEMIRATRAGGIIFGNFSQSLEYIKDNTGMKQTDPLADETLKSPSHFYFFEK